MRNRHQQGALELIPERWAAIHTIPLGISLGFIGEGLRKQQEGAQIQEAFQLKNLWLSSPEMSNRRNSICSPQFRAIPSSIGSFPSIFEPTVSHDLEPG